MSKFQNYPRGKSASILRLLSKLITVFLTACLIISCGDSSVSSSGSGGSGIGGTGISLVKGNVSTINGIAVASLSESKNHVIVVRIVNLATSESFAQSENPGNLKVSGGSRTTTLNSSGMFQLNDVVPSPDFILTFTCSTGNSVTLPIGSVGQSKIVTVSDITLNCDERKANAGNIKVENNEDKESEDDVSEDDISEDDVSEDDISEDETEDDVSEDDISEEEIGDN